MTALTLGIFSFVVDPSSMNVDIMRKSAMLHLAGEGFNVQDLGEYVEIWGFRGVLTGANANTDLSSIVTEARRTYAIKISNVPIRGDIYGRIINIQPRVREGYVNAVWYDFTVASLGLQSENKRGIVFDWKNVDNDWNLTGDIVVPVSIGASNVSETVDFNRTGADGTIPCVLAPYRSDIWFDVAEANMDYGKIAVSYSGNELVVHNQLVKLQTRDDEGSNQGQVDVSFYNGASWILTGQLSVLVKSAGGSEESLDNKLPSYSTGPEMPWGPPYRASNHVYGRLIYPSSTTNQYLIALYYELWRGKPFIYFNIYNHGVQLSQVKYKFIFNTSVFAPRYWNRNGTEVDATAAAYGEVTQAGDTDMDNVAYFNTASPVDATTDIVGFSRETKLNCDHVGDDAGNNWDYGATTFDTLTVVPSNMSKPIWLFAYRYGQSGSRTPAQVGAEAIKQIRSYQETLRRVTW